MLEKLVFLQCDLLDVVDYSLILITAIKLKIAYKLLVILCSVSIRYN